MPEIGTKSMRGSKPRSGRICFTVANTEKPVGRVWPFGRARAKLWMATAPPTPLIRFSTTTGGPNNAVSAAASFVGVLLQLAA